MTLGLERCSGFNYLSGSGSDSQPFLVRFIRHHQNSLWRESQKVFRLFDDFGHIVRIVQYRKSIGVEEIYMVDRWIMRQTEVNTVTDFSPGSKPAMTNRFV